MTTRNSLMEETQEELVVTLARLDRDPEASRPLAVPKDQMEFAHALLLQLLTDPDVLREHAGLLAREYRAPFQPPAPRRDRAEGEAYAPPQVRGFAHCEPPPPARVKKLLEAGPRGLDAGELAELLLNPFALYDLAEQIGTELPGWWVEPLAAAGRAILARHGLTIGPPYRRLWEELRSGKDETAEKALAKLIQLKRPSLRQALEERSPGDASLIDRALQETWLTVWRRRREIVVDEGLGSWLKDVAIDSLKNAHAERSPPGGAATATGTALGTSESPARGGAGERPAAKTKGPREELRHS